MSMRSTIASLLPAALAGTLLLGACIGVGNSPPTRFFALSVVEPSDNLPDASSGGLLVVGPVTLPPELDRPQLVTRLGPHERKVHETARWAAPLGEHVARVLAEDLYARLKPRRVAVGPVKAGTDYDRRVALDIVAFDVVPGGDCELSVRWTVHDSGGKLLTAIHTSVQSVTEGERPEDIVAAMSGSLAALADAIAAALALLGDPAGG
ncbi:MAG: PqiC family protein [Planctomycetota bacterium]|jgi:uncharacterized lipoprotein YmbA